MNIKVSSEEELKEIAATLLHLSYKVRYWQQLWDLHHGAEYLRAKKKWQKKLDDYHEFLGATKTLQQTEVHIEIKNNETP